MSNAATSPGPDGAHSSSNPPQKRFDAHVYAVVRVKVTGAGAISDDPEVVAEVVANAVSANSSSWMRAVPGRVQTPVGLLDVETVEFAEDVEAVLVDEIVQGADGREETVEHLFDHTGEPLRPYPGCRTVREGELKKQNDALIAALAKCRDLVAIPPPGDPLENDWIAAMADPLAVPGLLQAAYAKQKAKASSATISSIRDVLRAAATNCPHTITQGKIVLEYAQDKPGANALAQLANRLSDAASEIASKLLGQAIRPMSPERITEVCGQIDLGDPDWVTQVVRAVEADLGIASEGEMPQDVSQSSERPRQ